MAFILALDKSHREITGALLPSGSSVCNNTKKADSSVLSGNAVLAEIM